MTHVEQLNAQFGALKRIALPQGTGLLPRDHELLMTSFFSPRDSPVCDLDLLLDGGLVPKSNRGNK